MERYAQIVDGVVHIVIESETDPDGINGNWVACGNAGPGWTYDGTNFIAPVPPPTQVDLCKWLIDLGPFFDRFGPAKIAVLTCTDAGVKAILTDVQIRKWVDLESLEVAQSVAYIGTKVPEVTAELQEQVLTTPVSAKENLALRKLFFS